MARGQKSTNGRRKPIDLTGLLSVDERDQVITLVTDIGDFMAKQISEMFDSRPATPTGTELSAKTNQENKPSKPDPKALVLASIDALRDIAETAKKNEKARSASFAKAHEILEKEEHDAMGSPQLAELKKEALSLFKKWQGLLVLRAKDMIINDYTESMSSAPFSDRGGRGRGGRGRGMRDDTDWQHSRGGRGGRGAVLRGSIRAARGGGGGRARADTADAAHRPPTYEIDPALRQRYPPLASHLWCLPLKKRKLLFRIMMLMVLSLEDYSSHARAFLLYLASSLHLRLTTLQHDETKVAQGLSSAFTEALASESLREQAKENTETDCKKPDGPQLKRKNSTLSSAASGVLVAPHVARSFGEPHDDEDTLKTATVGVLLGTVGENMTALGSLFGLQATKPNSKTMEQFAKDTQDLALLPLYGELQTEYKSPKDVPPQHRRMRLVIGIGGWKTEDMEITDPWRFFGSQAEGYTLRWELATLTHLGMSLETVARSTAWALARKDFLVHTTHSCLNKQTAWPTGLVKISKLIDNPWCVGMVRAEKAGLVLADVLMRKVQGNRPVSLVGYSLGARTIYTCLMVLAERRQFGLIDSVVMIGTPAPSEKRVWLTLKSVVAGRLVNVFSDRDCILAFLCRLSNTEFGVAGIQPVMGAEGVENHSVSHAVSSHMRYQFLVSSILRDIGWEDLDMSRIAQDTQLLVKMDEKYNNEQHRIQATVGNAAMNNKEKTRFQRQGKERRRGRAASNSKLGFEKLTITN